ncbi:hypothetical protein ILFOPFJJ_03900 [Ensifer psoraleae]|nr:hypothetical protein [Sinorhizobium psoraleae]
MQALLIGSLKSGTIQSRASLESVAIPSDNQAGSEAALEIGARNEQCPRIYLPNPRASLNTLLATDGF